MSTDISRLIGDLTSHLMPNFSNIFNNNLSSISDFARSTTTPTSYSQELASAGDYFARDEVVISTFDQLHNEIRKLTDKNPELPLLWRGVRDARWGMHSGLFRKLMIQNGVIGPASRPTGPQPYPDEDQMVAAEKAILRVARSEWRFDGAPGLELLARLQHYGAPTRLLDVTRNPYIAAWFAVEAHPDEEDADARLFAMSTVPVLKDGDIAPDVSIVLDETGSLRDPFWHYLADTEARQKADWGTGAKRRVWIPPGYEQRIVAQNAGFIIDGVPMTSPSIMKYFRKQTTGNDLWTRSDLLAASSIYAKTAYPHRRPQPNRPNLAPTFTFRITADAKTEIRSLLERRFSYNRSTIYPDIAALAQHLDNNFDEVTGT